MIKTLCLTKEGILEAILDRVMPKYGFKLDVEFIDDTLSRKIHILNSYVYKDTVYLIVEAYEGYMNQLDLGEKYPIEIIRR